ncbi:TRAP transporter substrate-binding protein [Caldimonas tepidiphila]|uniref:TRAP transporter substrate-binding protein n=1 Tax=Caldimonas tepidiphila TaxID=2315841 RepID=UPI001F0BDBAC|nr:TRAP transporter substrate-binding protein [Caldimonas tepidiphila]
MKKTLKLALTATVLAAAAASAGAQEVTLKFHHIWTPNAMVPQKVIEPWCAKIAAESNNRMKCQLFPSMQLGGTPAQLIDQVKDGVVDLTITLPGYTAGRFPVMEVFELPFMTSSAEAGAKAAWDFYTKYGQKEFASVKPLFFSVHDEGYLHTRAKQVKTMEDLRGMKFRAPTRMTNKLLASLGATPVAMPLPAVPEAVSKGVIDGFLLPWEVFPALKLHEMVKHHTLTPEGSQALYTSVFVMAMNPAKYNSLPADLKAVIDRNSGASLSAMAGRAWDESQETGRKAAEGRGNTFHTLPDTEIDRWKKASAGLYDEYVANMDKLGQPGKQMLQEARDLLVKHGTGK